MWLNAKILKKSPIFPPSSLLMKRHDYQLCTNASAWLKSRSQRYTRGNALHTSNSDDYSFLQTFRWLRNYYEHFVRKTDNSSIWQCFAFSLRLTYSLVISLCSSEGICYLYVLTHLHYRIFNLLKCVFEVYSISIATDPITESVQTNIVHMQAMTEFFKRVE